MPSNKEEPCQIGNGREETGSLAVLGRNEVASLAGREISCESRLTGIGRSVLDL